MLKQEGVERLFAYPVNPVIESCAEENIRTVIVRQERTGLHMADAVGRLSSGRKVGVFAMQHGPGAENSFGGVAQAYSESVPLMVLPAGYARGRAGVHPHFGSLENYRGVTKSVERVTVPAAVPGAPSRRPRTAARAPAWSRSPGIYSAPSSPAGWTTARRFAPSAGRTPTPCARQRGF